MTGSLAGMRGAMVGETAGAALWDIGDGVACLEGRTKMNVLDPTVFDAIHLALREIPAGFRALVIGGDHPRAFSAGADLAWFLGRVQAGDWAALEDFLIAGQEALLALKYAPFPVVGAAFGLALGGGCEVLLHCRAVVAQTELAAGLPEAGVGLVPSWGGCTQMLLGRARQPGAARGPLAPAEQVFPLILQGRISTSATEARDMAVLGAEDAIVPTRSGLLEAAKARALALAPGPPAPDMLVLAGPSGKSALMARARGLAAQGQLSAHDLVIAEALAAVLTGGATDPLTPLSERQVGALEREAVLSLARLPATAERIAHMLATGKRLRN
jgi:3-hydroxyacyl-CoA dehydrogenase